MSERTWDGEPDFRPRGSKLAALGRWLGRLSFIGLLTLAAAYYVPLHRAHRALTERQRETTAELGRANAALASTKAELATARAALGSLKDREDAVRAKAATEKSTEEAAVSRATTKLAKLVSRNVVALAARDRRFVASYSARTAAGVEALPPAAIATRLGLCEVATAVSGTGPGSPISVTVFADAAPGSPSKSRFEAAAERTTRLVDTLEGTCRVPRGRAQGVVADPPSDGEPGGVEVAVSFEP